MQNQHENKQIQGIGGSDIAALLGLSPFKTPLELWAQKVGHPIRKPIEGVHLRFGQFVEPFVALEYERLTGLHTLEHSTSLFHPKHEFMYGHIDRFVMPQAGMPAVVLPAPLSAYLTEAVVKEIIASNILPEGALQLICGTAKNIFDTVESQDVITFTGSATT